MNTAMMSILRNPTYIYISPPFTKSTKYIFKPAISSHKQFQNQEHKDNYSTLPGNNRRLGKRTSRVTKRPLSSNLQLFIHVSQEYINFHNPMSITYDHRLKRIGHPVRSAIHKLQIGGLVVGWVTTSESPLLYVLLLLFLPFYHSLTSSLLFPFSRTSFLSLVRCLKLYVYLFVHRYLLSSPSLLFIQQIHIKTGRRDIHKRKDE
ncbi:hypothetical protein BCIN_15g03760 [Botrytis cinerea B05.10]|uniref:Uncharacterized protein n=1 Tax=Botryotinia fuckeliana (strain B05.10) TaxID=332648 RepID=A0A384K5M5_BOTFB|nr:hypothetical protein BCIN_15g03760 [Botrytis cinerea B05.10]ATZ57847.1 hypothetical protein BCIN_15g03760 [Botrytis cinerea B05.10]